MLLFIIILVILFILFGFHYKKFKRKTNLFDIIQIDNVLTNYTKYIDDIVPIIFRNHTSNIINKYIVSPLTISRTTVNKSIKNYVYHTHDLLFIIPKEDIVVNLLIPSEISHFKYRDNTPVFKNLDIINNNYNYTEIILDKDMIFYIPRYWIFNIPNGENTDILYIDTIFTFFFSKF